MRWFAFLPERFRGLFAAKTLGRRGEDAAARYLRRLGYVIVARGHRDHIGELDLIAVDGRTVVFVEVKTRTSHDAGHPADAVDEAVQRRLTRPALVLEAARLLEYALVRRRRLTWPPAAATHDRHFRTRSRPSALTGCFLRAT
jgi:putative endonuclease